MTHNKKSLRENTMKWPYPVNYGKENEVGADVLILGGGIAGCHAAINAARKGARVAIVEKGSVIRSGAGGAGVDHWHMACTNPCSKITPEEMIVFLRKGHNDYDYGEFGNGIASYILCKESYDTLLDVEQMGLKVRDVEDEFAGAEFRDDETKLMFAYDYENKYCIRVNGGAVIKVALYNECTRLGVSIHDRIMATSLLTEGGKQCARVVGATGIDVRTGEFYIFNAKSTILSMNAPHGLWTYSTELNGGANLFSDPNNAGEGTVMAWNAGAEITGMESSNTLFATGGFRYPPYSTGNAHNTYFACTIVDADGKEIPWVDRDGRELKMVSERYRPAPGQKMFLPYGRPPYEVQAPHPTPTLPERIKKGEFKLPLYADLPGMPEHERRALWGLMVGNEGKTLIPIYDVFGKAGFDPDKDMLQVNVMPPEFYINRPWWMGMGPPQWREIRGGGLVFDWDLKTSLDGLYAAGAQLASGSNHAGSATTGRYAGRKAAEYAKIVAEPIIDGHQVEEEKRRVYAPIKRKDGIGWKELWAGSARIMQDYCGEYKSEETLEMGLRWLKSIKESEASNAYARNPHELMCTLECMTRLTAGEMVIHASLARRASSLHLEFKRIDYPETDPPEWDKFVTIRLEDRDVKVGELPFDYWLKPPNATSYEENYKKHCGI